MIRQKEGIDKLSKLTTSRKLISYAVSVLISILAIILPLALAVTAGVLE